MHCRTILKEADIYTSFQSTFNPLQFKNLLRAFISNPLEVAHYSGKPPEDLKFGGLTKKCIGHKNNNIPKTVNNVLITKKMRILTVVFKSKPI